MYMGVQERLTRPQPLDYGVVQGLMTALCGRYACLRSVVIGRSVLRREIPALVLSAPHPREQVLVVCSLGAQEWWSAWCALRLCEELCSHLRAELSLCDVPLARAFRQRQVWFVPLPNPDGVEIARYGSAAAGANAAAAARSGADTPGVWQGNACGVDISSNFTAVWEELQAFPQKNGENPTAQPETAALADLCRRVAFRYAVVLGCGGESIDAHSGADAPPHSAMMAQVLGAVSGYTLVAPPPTADFPRWFIHTFRRPALALRLGRGAPPLSLRDSEAIYAKAREMLLLSLLF